MRLLITMGIVGLTTLILTSGAFADSGSWTIIEAPGAYETWAFGIESKNIVGRYNDNSGWHGFLYNGTTWSTLDMPGENIYYTDATGINGDNIVGYYENTYGVHSFSCDGSTWKTLDMPGSNGTWAYGIDGSNIVGSYTDDAGSHGFTYDGSTWKTLDMPLPGLVSTVAYGIDGNNIVGSYNALGGSHGFIYDGKNWTILNVPLQSYAYDTDGCNIVGVYWFDLTPSVSFIYTIPEPSTIIFLGLGFMPLINLKNHKHR